MKTVQKLSKYSLLITLLFSFNSCSNSSKKQTDATLTEKKVELQKLINERTKLDDKIKTSQLELAKIDTSTDAKQKPKLVAVAPIQLANFSHYLELQGTVMSENISYVTPKGGPGQVTALFVKRGDQVRKGQLLLTMESALARQNVLTVRQSMGAIQTQIALAKSVYERQKNLWNQNIGTEVQLLQAKTNLETLQAQLRTAEDNVKAAQQQLSYANVYSNVDGVADDVSIHVGETFTGSPLNGIKIVNSRSLKVVTDIPENYLNRVKKGSKVGVIIPDIQKTFTSNISVLGQSVSANSRGTTAEIKIPYDPLLRPNQIALVKILDYNASSTIVVSVNAIQTDDKGKFVLVAAKEDDKLFARKRIVQIGELYKDQIEVKQGLKVGDLIITEGFQGLYDGQLLTTAQ
ncbi:MAG: efflux RND transporter periplasmic adaptor subunit [Ginsengibacter sp.]